MYSSSRTSQEHLWTWRIDEVELTESSTMVRWLAAVAGREAWQWGIPQFLGKQDDQQYLQTHNGYFKFQRKAIINVNSNSFVFNYLSLSSKKHAGMHLSNIPSLLACWHVLELLNIFEVWTWRRVIVELHLCIIVAGNREGAVVRSHRHCNTHNEAYYAVKTPCSTQLAMFCSDSASLSLLTHYFYYTDWQTFYLLFF